MNPSEEIQKLRSGLGLSQKEFADLVGISQPTISRWETGAAKPSRFDMIAVRQLVAKRKRAA